MPPLSTTTLAKFFIIQPRPGSVVVERSLAMLEVGGLIPGRVKKDVKI